MLATMPHTRTMPDAQVKGGQISQLSIPSDALPDNDSVAG